MAEVPKPKGQYLKAAQVAEFEGQLRSADEAMKSPHIPNKKAVASFRRGVEKTLAEQAPPEVKGPELDAVAKREAQLAAEIAPHMMSSQEMRGCPTGAIGRYQRGEGSPEVKDKILEWKNMRRILNRGNSDPDIANAEHLRPKTSHLNMDDRIVGSNTTMSFSSPQYQENFDEIDWSQHEGLNEAIEKRVRQQVAKSLEAITAPEPKASSGASS